MGASLSRAAPLVATVVETMIISMARPPAISPPSGMYRTKPCRSWAKSTSSIMTTNRNSTATAPT